VLFALVPARCTAGGHGREIAHRAVEPAAFPCAELPSGHERGEKRLLQQVVGLDGTAGVDARNGQQFEIGRTRQHLRRASQLSAGIGVGVPLASTATMTKPAWVTRSITSDR